MALFGNLALVVFVVAVAIGILALLGYLLYGKPASEDSPPQTPSSPSEFRATDNAPPVSGTSDQGSDPGGEWVKKPKADTAVVFVHGILSDSNSCWRNGNAYWPEFLMHEKQLESIGIYTFSYRSDVLAVDYSLGDAVDALNTFLKLDGLLELRNLIFVCHSMGGIVVRRFVVARESTLVERGSRIGLFLVASPSLGSPYANLIEKAAKALGNSQAEALRIADKNPWLRDLDRDFINLKEANRVFLRGKELVEDEFIMRSFWVRLFARQVVRSSSGARYFGESIKIPKSTHFTIAKPAGRSAIQHRLLVRFIEDFLQQCHSVERFGAASSFNNPERSNASDQEQRSPSKQRDGNTLGPRSTAEPLKGTNIQIDSTHRSFKELNQTMSNPKYEDDVLKLDASWNRSAVINLTTVIIVVSKLIVAELLDRPVAEKIRNEIDSRGGKYPFRRGVVISDAAWYLEEEFLRNNPVIAVGGPKSNDLSREFEKWVPSSPSGEGVYQIDVSEKLTGFFRLNEFRLPQVGLWGEDANGTLRAVEHYIANPRGLSEFLRSCWTQR